jgi:hypothetical protein
MMTGAHGQVRAIQCGEELALLVEMKSLGHPHRFLQQGHLVWPEMGARESGREVWKGEE